MIFQTRSLSPLRMSLLVRSVSRLANTVPKRSLAVSSSLRADQMMPDPLEHATGQYSLHILINYINVLILYLSPQAWRNTSCSPSRLATRILSS